MYRPAIATEPEVLLMDEPCSALDPIATRRIEELMHELKKKYTIAIVTHNLQQAMRVADKTAFMYVDTSRGGRTGYLVEYRDTRRCLKTPRKNIPSSTFAVNLANLAGRCRSMTARQMVVLASAV